MTQTTTMAWLVTEASGPGADDCVELAVKDARANDAARSTVVSEDSTATVDRIEVDGDLGGRQTVFLDGCVTCDEDRAKGSWFFPAHYASSRCQSGRHPHCTCDTCW